MDDIMADGHSQNNGNVAMGIDQNGSSQLPELEEKAQEITGMMFALCEKRILHERRTPTPSALALAASAVAAQSALSAFMSIERITD